METEVLLAIVGVGATLVAGLVYAIRKWVDCKGIQQRHEQKLQLSEISHSQKIEEQREARNNARIEMDKQTGEYIATNTETLRALQKTIEGMQDFQKELMGDGLTGLLRESIGVSRETLEIVQRIEREHASTAD